MTDFPWQLNSKLKREHIIEIANYIAQIRGEVIDLYDEELGDTPLSLGIRAYECCRSRIITGQNSGKMPYLDIITPNKKFTFSINGIPVRFVRNDPDCLPSEKLVPSSETVVQIELFSDENSNANIIWFYVIDTNFKHVADNMYFVGYNENGKIICKWDIPLEEQSTRLAEIKVSKTTSVDLPKPQVRIKNQNKTKKN